MYIQRRIRKHEVGLWFRHGDFKGVLQPGLHRIWGVRRNRDKIEVYNTLDGQFVHAMMDLLVAEPAVRQELEIVELTDDQRALVWRDGRLGWILGPGRHAFWKQPVRVAVEVFDIADFRFQHAKIEAVLNHAGGVKFMEPIRVDAHERVLLFREGKLFEQLEPGLHVFWRSAQKLSVRTVDLREQVADVSGQEIMTADKVTLRVNLLVSYQITDPEASVTKVVDVGQTLYREAQLALREAVGGRELDKLLGDKDVVGDEIRGVLGQRVAGFGVAIRGVGLRDIILPGEMKMILNQVITAQKQAEANLIRRREETAAARSQVNTARLMAEHPALARLKELESLQEILAGVDATFVLGGGDLAEQVKSLVSGRKS
jgi:regulator of protease activity HflC (stomatin/prohibitin superfamily)